MTQNHLAWCVITLNAMRFKDLKEREVLSTSKLYKDKRGKSKTGANVGGSVVTAVDDYDVPVANIDFCCTDTTASNSSLCLPKNMGGTGGEGGAYAHLWAHFRSKGHILFFMIWCLSHCASNEVGFVMRSCGGCRRSHLLRKKGQRKDLESALPRGHRSGPAEHATEPPQRSLCPG